VRERDEAIWFGLACALVVGVIVWLFFWGTGHVR
jgi:hypothetical protein